MEEVNCSQKFMTRLFEAIACKELEGKKYLFPGYALPRSGGITAFKPGDQIKVERQDGTFSETTVQGVKACIFDDNLMRQLNMRVDSGFYFAIEVPEDFDCTGIVYLDEKKRTTK
jgi:hypothetical protein